MAIKEPTKIALNIKSYCTASNIKFKMSFIVSSNSILINVLKYMFISSESLNSS